MENNDLKELRWVLHMQEEINQANSGALLIIFSKIVELEQVRITQNANYMNLLLLKKHQIYSLENECIRLRFLVLSQHLDSLSLAYNNHGTQSSNQVGIVEAIFFSKIRYPWRLKV